EIFSLEARRISPVIIRRKIFEAPDLPGQESASQGAVGHESNAEFARCGKNFVLWIARPQGIFSLQRRNGMHLVRAAYGRGGSFRQSEIANFSGLHQPGH